MDPTRILARAALVVTGLLPFATAAPGAAADPAASLAASPFVCLDDTPDCAGPLATGDHATVHFDVPFTFATADGQWINNLDRYRAYSLMSVEAPESEFQVYSHAAPEAQTDDCSAAREPGYGTTTAEWLRYLTSHPGLDVTAPTTTDLGGRTLTSVMVSVKPTWTKVCPDNTDPVVLVVTDTEDPPTRRRYAGGSMGFVDVGEEAVVIVVDASGGVTMDQMLTRATPVIESIRFTGATPSPVPAS